MHKSIPMPIAIAITTHKTDVQQLCKDAGITTRTFYYILQCRLNCTDRVASAIGRVLDLSPEFVKEAFDDMQRAQKGAPK
jgi:hypothetical protein